MYVITIRYRVVDAVVLSKRKLTKQSFVVSCLLISLKFRLSILSLQLTKFQVADPERLMSLSRICCCISEWKQRADLVMSKNFLAF